MLSFVSGIITGCLLGVSGTILLVLMASAMPGNDAKSTWRISSTGAISAFLTILIMAYGSHALRLGRTSTVLLFLLSALVISRLTNLAGGLLASGLAAVVLSVAVLPPIGSIGVSRPRDRLILTLFLLSSFVGSRLAAAKKTRP